MKAQNAHEDILIVCAFSHCFDEVNMCMFCTLAVGVIRVAPHDDLTDLVQDAVGFVKIPTPRFCPALHALPRPGQDKIRGCYADPP
jgi:hypothetical protein